MEALGAAFVALSPEKPEFAQLLADKQKLTFPVLTDHENLISRKYGLVYQMNSEVKAIALNFGNDISKRNGSDKWELPVPGTFVIDMKEVVCFARVDPNFMTGRANPEAVLDILTKLCPALLQVLPRMESGCHHPDSSRSTSSRGGLAT
jgi:peroxiredoxin